MSQPESKTEKDLKKREKNLEKREKQFHQKAEKWESLYTSEDSKKQIIWRFFFNNLYWIFIVCSLLLMILNVQFWNNWKHYELIEKIAIAILTSGVFATVLKSFQFTGLFQTEIRKVILGTEFIDNRKDIVPLWRKVSKRLYKDRFPDISDKIESYILDTYFPMNNDYYYDNVFYHIEIESLTEDYLLTYIQSWKADVVLAEGVHETSINWILSIDKDVDENGKIPKDELLCSKIDGEEIKLVEDDSTKDDEYKSLYKVIIKRTYNNDSVSIEIKSRRIYSMKVDNIKTFKFSTFVKNMNVVINYPQDVHVNFINIGNKNSFEKQSTGTKGMIHRTFINDIIFPYQGWGITVRRNKV